MSDIRERKEPRAEAVMAGETYRLVFLGLIDDLPETKEKFRQNVTKLFKIAGPQVDKLLTKSPVVIKKNLAKQKADSIAKKLELIGGNVRVKPDEPAQTESQRIVRKERAAAKFAIYINKIESEDAKHGIAKYLDSVLEITYIDIRNELLKDIPAVLPAEFQTEEAKKIRDELEKLGSRASIGKIRQDYDEYHKTPSRTNKREIAILAGILVLVVFGFIFLISALKHEESGLETTSVRIDEEILNSRDEQAESAASMPLAKEVVRALQELHSRYKQDISYDEYMEILRDTRSEVNSYLKSEEAENRVQIATSILNVLIHYQNVEEIWKYKNKYNTSYVRKNRNDIQSYLRRYPNASKPLSEGGAIDNLPGGEEILRIDAVVSIAMEQAGDELRGLSKVLELPLPIY
ncbi:MAG: hypothetical protein GTN81_13460 [Proteobacteria bacterium]|nr:hypothetical protein [Pseudomonadota bacterium]